MSLSRRDLLHSAFAAGAAASVGSETMLEGADQAFGRLLVFQCRRRQMGHRKNVPDFQKPGLRID